MAMAASNAAIDADEPPPEPPGIRAWSHGLCVGPYAEFSVDEPMANSSMFVLPSTTTPASRNLREAGVVVLGKTNMDEFVLPSTTTPASRNLRVTVASYGGI